MIRDLDELRRLVNTGRDELDRAATAFAVYYKQFVGTFPAPPPKRLINREEWDHLMREARAARQEAEDSRARIVELEEEVAALKLRVEAQPVPMAPPGAVAAPAGFMPALIQMPVDDNQLLVPTMAPSARLSALSGILTAYNYMASMQSAPAE
jgi:hypothetical protein